MLLSPIPADSFDSFRSEGDCPRMILSKLAQFRIIYLDRKTTVPFVVYCFAVEMSLMAAFQEWSKWKRLRMWSVGCFVGTKVSGAWRTMVRNDRFQKCMWCQISTMIEEIPRNRENLYTLLRY